jgi:hypothetical protein
VKKYSQITTVAALKVDAFDVNFEWVRPRCQNKWLLINCREFFSSEALLSFGLVRFVRGCMRVNERFFKLKIEKLKTD